jgi:hypothetical protein
MKYKILIIGEMSGAAMNLKLGFKFIGCDVVHVGYKNIFREIEPDINLSKYNGVKGAIDRIIKSVNFVLFDNYDFVIFTRYWEFPFYNDYLNEYLFKILKRSTNYIFFWSLSCDYIVRNDFKYTSPLCANCLKYDQQSTICKYETKQSVSKELVFKRYIDMIVPGAIEYADAYKNEPNVSKQIIPISIFIDNSETNFITYNKINDKLIIYHSISRNGFKGSELMLNALRRYQGLNNFELKLEEKVPYEKHKINIVNSNVVIDQLYNRSFGMNSLLTLISNRLLIAGGISDLLINLDIKDEPPYLPISQYDLNRTYEFLNNNKNSLIEMSNRGRDYVSKHFNSISAAQNFIKFYQNKK